jgi:hypothetical protein
VPTALHLLFLGERQSFARRLLSQHFVAHPFVVASDVLWSADHMSIQADRRAAAARSNAPVGNERYFV